MAAVDFEREGGVEIIHHAGPTRDAAALPRRSARCVTVRSCQVCIRCRHAGSCRSHAARQFGRRQIGPRVRDIPARVQRWTGGSAVERLWVAHGGGRGVVRPGGVGPAVDAALRSTGPSECAPASRGHRVGRGCFGSPCRGCRAIVGAGDEQGWAVTDQAMSGLSGTIDTHEGVRVFLEKRQPVWTGG